MILFKLFLMIKLFFISFLIFLTFSVDSYANKIHCHTKFCSVVRSGDIKLAEKMLKKSPKLVHEKIHNDISMIHFAVLEQDFPMLKLLVQYKANVNIQSIGGATPLHMAARIGLASHAKLLLDSGANIDIPDGEGYTPIMRATLLGKSDVVITMLDYKPNCMIRSSNGLKLDSMSMNKLTPQASDKLKEYLSICRGN